MTTFETYVEVTDHFIANAVWLTDDEAPQVLAMRNLARELDRKFSVRGANEYGTTYRYLRNLKPVTKTPADDRDDLDDELDALRKSVSGK